MGEGINQPAHIMAAVKNLRVFTDAHPSRTSFLNLKNAAGIFTAARVPAMPTVLPVPPANPPEAVSKRYSPFKYNLFGN